MIVITMTDCPPRLRGDLSRWLCEVSTGVYAGQLSARVRDELWQRVCEHLKNGRATMVFSTNNEQRMDFRVHNAVWEPIDFDGMKLMLRPNVERLNQNLTDKPKPVSNAAKYKLARARASAKPKPKSNYVVIDVETTGLSCLENEIIELAAICVQDGKPLETYTSLICTRHPIPENIEKLTGITNEALAADGKPLADALNAFLAFVGNERVVAHNAAFDYAFLRAACQTCNLPLFSNPCADTLTLARRKLDSPGGYKLAVLADRFGFDASGAHRGLKDCQLTQQLYEKLIEK